MAFRAWCQVELQDSEIIFDPPFQSHKQGDISLRATIDGWLKDFFATVTCMQRLDTGSGDYLNEIREHFQMLLGSMCADKNFVSCWGDIQPSSQRCNALAPLHHSASKAVPVGTGFRAH